jgi:hypothetical protein
MHSSMHVMHMHTHTCVQACAHTHSVLLWWYGKTYYHILSLQKKSRLKRDIRLSILLHEQHHNNKNMIWTNTTYILKHETWHIIANCMCLSTNTKTFSCVITERKPQTLSLLSTRNFSLVTRNKNEKRHWHYMGFWQLISISKTTFSTYQRSSKSHMTQWSLQKLAYHETFHIPL